MKTLLRKIGELLFGPALPVGIYRVAGEHDEYIAARSPREALAYWMEVGGNPRDLITALDAAGMEARTRPDVFGQAVGFPEALAEDLSNRHKPPYYFAYGADRL